MSGLFARARLAGPDGVRNARSQHIGDIGSARVTSGIPRVSTDRSFHLLRPASLAAIRRATFIARQRRSPSCRHCCRRPTVDTARHHQAPRDACELVRKGHCDQLRRLALQHRREPRSRLVSTRPDVSQQRCGPDDEDRSQRRVPSLGDPAVSHAAARRVIPGR